MYNTNPLKLLLCKTHYFSCSVTNCNYIFMLFFTQYNVRELLTIGGYGFFFLMDVKIADSQITQHLKRNSYIRSIATDARKIIGSLYHSRRYLIPSAIYKSQMRSKI